MDAYKGMGNSKKEVRIASSDIYEIVKVGIEYVMYLVSYAIYAMGRFFESDTWQRVKGAVAARAVPMVATVIIYVIIGLVGGLEAGLVSAVVGIPLCLVFIGLLALIPRED